MDTKGSTSFGTFLETYDALTSKPEKSQQPRDTTAAIIKTLATKGPMPLTELIERQGISPAELEGPIAKLHKLEAINLEGFGLTQIVTLTDKGRELLGLFTA